MLHASRLAANPTINYNSHPTPQEHYQIEVEKLKQKIRTYVTEKGDLQHVNLLENAFNDITHYHRGQKRRSGEPFIIHPLRVADSICSTGLDAPTVVASVLHDVIEDTSITRQYIAERYGEWYAGIVDGLTKIKSHDNSSQQQVSDLEATYQKMLVGMVRDVRTLFIKLFDRLDNMRDMEAMPASKKRKTSKETLNVYVPLARRFGLEHLSQEHTELCFRHLYPRRYSKTIDKLHYMQKSHSAAILSMKNQIAQSMEVYQLNVSIKEIWVHPASCINQKKILNHVLERFSLIVPDEMTIYQALGALHLKFNAVPLKIRDFVSNPLWSGYQGLQTKIIIDEAPILIEIVSQKMQNLNRHGIMAHWQGTPSELTDYYQTYLNQLDHLAGATELRIVDVMRYVQPDQIQVFTPRGEILNLPAGATILDFAYHIHSDLGNHCAGALVNEFNNKETFSHYQERQVPRYQTLTNGECIRIFTDPKIVPTRDWYAQSITARSHINIKRSLRKQNVKKAIAIGRSILQQQFENLPIEVEKWLTDKLVVQAFQKEQLTSEKFLEELGLQKRNLKQFLHNHQFLSMNLSLPQRARFHIQINFANRYKFDNFLIKNPKDSCYHFAECCHPIIGDKAIGFANDSKEIEIHRSQCQAIQLHQGMTVSPIIWELPQEVIESRTLSLITVEDTGILFQISKVIKNEGIGIRDSRSDALNPEEASFRIHLEPISWKAYHKVVARLRTYKFVKKVW